MCVLFLCSSSDLDECTYVINGTDVVGGEGMAGTTDEAMLKHIKASTEPCVFQGQLNVARNWYGYLAKVTLAPKSSIFYYHITFAKVDCCIKVLLYLEEQMKMLKKHMSCTQRQSVLDPMGPQVIILSPSNPKSGCRNKTDDQGVSVIDCYNGRWLTSNRVRNWYIAVTSCGSPKGLDLQFSVVIYGHIGECPASSFKNSATHNDVTSCYYVILTTLCVVLINLISPLSKSR